MTPEGLYGCLRELHDAYAPVPLIVTENGSAWQDVLDPDGHVHDERRCMYLSQHLVQVHRAISDGIPVAGYFAWSLLDNFEWAFGYRTRFGLVYTEFASQKRWVKDSGYYYRDIIRANGLAF